MFDLLFGGLWTLVSLAFLFLGYCSDVGTITVNGRVVSRAEFKTMAFPKVFLGIFLFIGLFFLTRGIIKILKNIATESKGEECFGKIIDVYPSGAYINDTPIYKADVLCYIPSKDEAKRFSESVGMKKNKFPEGSYVNVKYYNGDINIKEIAYENSIPLGVKQILDNKSGAYANNSKDKNSDVIEFNGIKYKRIDE